MNTKENKRKRFIRAVGFIAVLIILLCKLSDFSLKSLRGVFNHEQFYNIPENSVDVIFLGPSTSYCGFSPIRLYDRYGISSYNFGSSNQSMLSCYLWAKEAYESQAYEVIVLEASSIMLSHGDYANDIRSLYSMGKSVNYFELMTVYKRNAYKVMFPIFVFHNSWKNMQKYMFEDIPNPETATFRGYHPIGSCASDYTDGPLVDTAVETIAYIKTPYLDKLREFCEEKGIVLILTKTTMGNGDVWNSELHNAVNAYAQEHGLVFIDFNVESVMKKAGIVMMKDMAADRNHMNISGAYKVTDFIGEYLVSLEDIKLDRYGSSQILTEKVIADYYEVMNAMQEGDK